MTNELHALTGAYAVDALDALERIRFERHLAVCADCSAEVHSLQAAAGELTHVVSAGPSTLVRDRVLAEIRTVRPLAPVPAPVEVVRHRARRFPQLVAAAVAAVILVVGAGILHPWSNQTAAPVASSVAERVMQASDARTQSVSFANGSTATLYHSHSVNRSVLVTDKLDPAPLGKAYEMWYISGKTAVPAGLITAGGKQTLVLHGKLGSATNVGITVESASGSTTPTAPIIADFELSKSV